MVGLAEVKLDKALFEKPKFIYYCSLFFHIHKRNNHHSLNMLLILGVVVNLASKALSRGFYNNRL